MKWIGQHIWSFISRFRSDVYVESSTVNVTNGADDDEYFQIKTLSQGVTTLTTVGDSTSDIKIKPASHKLLLGDTDGNNFTVENQAHDNGAGSTLSIKAGSATAGQTNQNGGSLNFYGGAPTGSGTFGNFNFYSGDVEASGTSLRTTSLIAQLKSEAATSTDLYLYEKAGSSFADFLKISVAEHGATTITTTDGAGTSANLQITADGTAELAGSTVTLDSAANIELEVGAATNYINTTGLYRGSNIGTIQDGKIPISPTEFLANSYRFHPQYSLAGGGITMPSASVNAYCEVIIPNGYTATACTMFATDVDNDGTIRCYSGSTLAGSTSALATASTFSSGTVTHDFGANDVDGNGAITVIIEWNPGDTTDVLHGGFISITKTT